MAAMAALTPQPTKDVPKKPSKASVPCVYPCGSFYWDPEQAASLLMPTQAPAMALMPAAASLADLAKMEVATLPTTRK